LLTSTPPVSQAKGRGVRPRTTATTVAVTLTKTTMNGIVAVVVADADVEGMTE